MYYSCCHKFTGCRLVNDQVGEHEHHGSKAQHYQYRRTSGDNQTTKNLSFLIKTTHHYVFFSHTLRQNNLNKQSAHIIFFFSFFIYHNLKQEFRFLLDVAFFNIHFSSCLRRPKTSLPSTSVWTSFTEEERQIRSSKRSNVNFAIRFTFILIFIFFIRKI